MNECIFDIDPKLLSLASEAENECREMFEKIDSNAEYNGQKVLKAFIDNRVSEGCLKGTTGYGYGDMGRDTIDKVFAQALGGEDALVRHTFVNGTHALSTALFGVLRSGDTMLACTGKPYDTLEEIIGIRGEKGNGSLIDFGVKYEQVDLVNEMYPDYDEIAKKAVGAKIAYIQRSRGYSLRPSLTVEIIGKIAETAKKANPDIIVMVDNCYGEFVERKEPLSVGADIIIGSLIKNPGGAIAPCGGYIVGRHDLVEDCAYRMTTPGLGREVGATLGTTRSLYMGLFSSPHVTGEALKTAVFAAALFDLLGFKVTPRPDETRHDIIEAICLENADRLIAFCQGMQKGAPVDSYVSPVPWDMPGYDSQVIMSAGAFTSGSSIELSSDAPLREPYAVWMQGGINFHSGKLGVMLAADEIIKRGLLE